MQLRKAALWVAGLVCFVLLIGGGSGCGDSGDETQGSGASSGSAGSSASAGTSDGSAGNAGSSASSSGGSSAGGSSAGGSSAGGASAGGSSAGGSSGGAADGSACGTTQCTNCIDDDNDGTIDAADVECTGSADNDEGSFATGIPGDNSDACKQDCFFDGNSGSGNDGCLWNLKCDPANPGAPECPYDPTYMNCPTQQSDECLANCRDYAPNGCDCFGCCNVPLPTGGTISIRLVPTCSVADLNDPMKCPRCTQTQNCNNTCERCELCLGKTQLPPDCFPPDAGVGGSGGAGGSAGSSGSSGTGGGGGNCPTPICSNNRQPCGTSCLAPCPAGYFCLTGCCTPPPP